MQINNYLCSQNYISCTTCRSTIGENNSALTRCVQRISRRYVSCQKGVRQNVLIWSVGGVIFVMFDVRS